jgi:hypothetical protein
MGDAKRKFNRRLEFLKMHPRCAYCAGPATTSDHCPPRSFFSRRDWPETYEFPACEPCNAAARLDEQALVVLFRCTFRETGEADQSEWNRLLDGVRNNQPHVLAEWGSVMRNEIKHGLRRTFGVDGDLLRHAGWGMANIGPLTQAMLDRFMIKLAKALYYKHNSDILDGVLYIYNIDIARRDAGHESLQRMLLMAPELADVKRNQRSLSEQFIYRFNNSREHGVMHTMVQFGDQFIFQILAMSRIAEQKLIELRGGVELSRAKRHECFLETLSTI